MSTYGDGTDSSRLGAHHPAERAHSAGDVVVQDELGDLGGLSTARLPAHHHYAAGADQVHQLLRREQGARECKVWEKGINVSVCVCVCVCLCVCVDSKYFK